MKLAEIPDGWVISSLGELLDDIFGGGTPSKSIPEYFEGNIPLMTVKDMKVSRPSSTGFNITEEGLENSSSKVVPADTVIIATRMGLGKVVRPLMPAAINQDLKALFPCVALDKSFLEKWLISQASSIESMGTGTTVKGIRINQVKELEVPLPPLNEQHRIVEKIDTLFARLDQGEAALRQVQTLLGRYRQSVLKAAVTGQLTADWRAENTHRLEPGEDLLQRILQTRRDNWQGRGKYKEPVPPDISGLPELPEGWVWASLDQLILAIEAGKNFRCDERPPDDEEIGIVKISAVTWEEFDENESKTIINSEQVNEALRIQEGDLLISRANTVELVGASVVVSEVKKKLQLSDKVLRLKLVCHIERWVNFFLRSGYGRQQIEAFATGAQMSMRNISQSNLRKIAVPLPPRHEIDELVALIVSMRDSAKQTLELCRTEFARLNALKQSTLKSAFSGSLVAQDPNDEPAIELLARIRAEREAEATAQATAKKKTKAKPRSRKPAKKASA